MQKNSDRFFGLLAGIIAAITYGLNPVAKILYDSYGFTAEAALFYRYAFSAAIMALLVFLRGHSFKLSRAELLPTLSLGVLMTLSSITLFRSYSYMDVGIASTVLFIYPMLVAIIMGVFFHEKITYVAIGCILLAIGGIFLLSNSGGETHVTWQGMTYAAASALFYAIYIVFVRESPARTLPAEKLTFYALLSGLPIYLCFLDFGASLPSIPDTKAWTCVGILVLFPTTISFFAMAFSIKKIGPTLAAILGALEPVSGACVGMIVFHEVMTRNLIFGMILILTAVIAIILEKQIMEGMRKFFVRERTN